MGNGACFCLSDGQVTDTEKAVLDLKILQRDLRKRASALERAVAAHKKSYRALAAEGATQRAKRRQMLLLRHIGSVQKAIDQCHVHWYRLDEMVVGIGEASTLHRVLTTMKDANRAMDSMTRLMQVDAVELMIQDGVKFRERHRELQTVIEANETRSEHDEFYVSNEELAVLQAQLETDLDAAGAHSEQEPCDSLRNAPMAPSGEVRLQASPGDSEERVPWHA